MAQGTFHSLNVYILRRYFNNNNEVFTNLIRGVSLHVCSENSANAFSSLHRDGALLHYNFVSRLHHLCNVAGSTLHILQISSLVFP